MISNKYVPSNRRCFSDLIRDLGVIDIKRNNGPKGDMGPEVAKWSRNPCLGKLDFKWSFKSPRDLGQAPVTQPFVLATHTLDPLHARKSFPKSDNVAYHPQRMPPSRPNTKRTFNVRHRINFSDADDKSIIE